MAAAIGAWNRSGARVRLVAVARAAHADVIIVASDRALARACLPRRDCAGIASRTGYHRNARRPARIYLTTAPAREYGDDAVATTIAAHELGHILGLGHRGGCSIMNNDALETTCRAKQLYPGSEAYLCGPMLADIKDAIALYGGRVRPGYRPVCPSASL